MLYYKQLGTKNALYNVMATVESCYSAKMRYFCDVDQECEIPMEKLWRSWHKKKLFSNQIILRTLQFRLLIFG